MKEIKLPILFAGSKGEKYLHTLFDIAVNMSCIHPDCVKEIADKQPMGIKRNIRFNNADNFIEINEAVCLDFYVNDVLLSDVFLIVANILDEVIIGAATIRKWRMNLNYDDCTVYVDPKAAHLKLI